ncbi:MAG: hypothetical protein ACREUC_08935 [Steroidobacteraceae bacterium]
MPVLFLAIVVWLLINTLMEKPVESIAGLVLIFLGLPLYFFYRRPQRPAMGTDSSST